MTVSSQLVAYHQREASVAEASYVAGLTSKQAATDWYTANVQARRDVVAALRSSGCLTDMASAIRVSGAHIRVFRHILAPPISQDQFKLLCPVYPKGAESSGGPVKPAIAATVATTINALRNKKLTRWLDRGGSPRVIEVRELIHAVSPLLSQQIVATVRRNRLSAEQEGAVLTLLQSKGWTRMTSALIHTLSTVPPKHFMHKTKFATGTQPQEVDVACGLGGDVVLAMECKVTNDKTNSVKRINDVLKKASAWQAHYGAFIHTAALLQGVIAYKDVHRLLAANVQVFWTHKLDDFGDWLDAHLKA